MPTIYAIVNQKGGVGKSTTAHALGAGLKEEGLRVLLIDMDQQGNLSYAMNAQEGHPGMGEVLHGQATAQQVLQALPQGDLLGASPSLAGADKTIDEMGKEYRLREALEPLLPRYDAIIIDTPPSMGILSVNALSAATHLIIPVQADIFSLQGVGQLALTWQMVRKYTNPGLAVRGLLLTRYSDRAVLSRNVRDMAAEAAEAFGSVVFDTTIREAVAIREAQISQQDIFTYAPKSNVAQDYRDFVREVMGS